MYHDDDKSLPREAPISEDQSDLPEISQAMPLHENLAYEPTPRAHVREDTIGLILTSSQLAELRVLRARIRRAEMDLDAFWERHVPGGVPGGAVNFKHG